VAIPATAVVVLLVVLRGCPGPDRPLDAGTVGRIQQGMSEQAVLELLGPPTEPLDVAEISRTMGINAGGYRCRTGGRKAEVYLIDGRVAGTVVVGY